MTVIKNFYWKNNALLPKLQLNNRAPLKLSLPMLLKPGILLETSVKYSVTTVKNMAIMQINARKSVNIVRPLVTSLKSVGRRLKILLITRMQSAPSACAYASSEFGGSLLSNSPSQPGSSSQSLSTAPLTPAMVNQMIINALSSMNISAANGDHLPIVSVGDAPGPFPLTNIFVSPHLATNLVSVGQLVENNYNVSFSSSGCVVQDQESRAVIARSYVETQFSKCIKTLRSDSGGEYVSTDFQSFIRTRGIISQRTCPYTPQQNRVTERKNKHLLDVTRTLLIESSVPPRFWIEALTTAVHLINRLPSPTIAQLTPHFKLFGHHPSCNHLHTFGCVCFVHLHPTERTKLMAQSSRERTVTADAHPPDPPANGSTSTDTLHRSS
ncbi:retrovirus-related Pol polyprotein from transposon TNT 1-94 [Cinnamomum micranthum f. kanehirae]|uniref:Retrovirus-related Pol polyprotein from transposon TNT 1-94 n=1 Tax=Cinnamomum micranthum f. kanehirae TaxID=337451 RepID=A0A3S4PH92_9MAGN|nr:retrovirus-related Pol polyprotein from transposon TNT 1-94 [Cinnamomum micranthum f. kanehirae]